MAMKVVSDYKNAFLLWKNLAFRHTKLTLNALRLLDATDVTHHLFKSIHNIPSEISSTLVFIVLHCYIKCHLTNFTLY